jgi:hypothetical protein
VQRGNWEKVEKYEIYDKEIEESVTNNIMCKVIICELSM